MAQNGSVRASPFLRQTGLYKNSGNDGSSPRPQSAILPTHSFDIAAHTQEQSFSNLNTHSLGNGSSSHSRNNSESKNGLTRSSTFAPSFIKQEDMAARRGAVSNIEGENDFSGKRYVWVKDPTTAFIKGWVVEELDGGLLLVQCGDGSQRQVDAESVDKVNPAKFDKADDMAELTHLNEASVVHNLHQRYQADLIYTYSGLFLVAINPYCPLPIYSNEYINMYKGRKREDTKPHIFAMADVAFRNLMQEGENQSILVTGESGAGKTETTKKVIQYLAAVANSSAAEPPVKNKVQQPSNLSAQILRANPILEAFGNAQTVRNHNSSRFGKFIRIEFTRTGAIAGAFIDWYLLEKSRVVRLSSGERNYHVFYQLLKGADKEMRQRFLLDSLDVKDFTYTKAGSSTIPGVSDRDEWTSLIDAFDVMGFSEEDQESVLRTVAAVLHLGNIKVRNESRGADQAQLAPEARAEAEKFCALLGIKVDPFLSGLLHPRVKAGREWVEKVQTPQQVRLAIDALAKGIYERGFGDLVSKINRQLDRTGMGLDDSHFIGVLDIAGFEIFKDNSFEQLCINYTNEKLQQFFNHHMFVLEQEEYAREKIAWNFIDFGHDLQPTIDLIELPNPIGIFSCLDEDSVMPKATDKSFTEKLHSLWDRKTPKYRATRLGQGFFLTHYAAEVEYSTEGWLEKNKDPLNDNVTRLLAASTDAHVANLFLDCADVDEESGAIRSRVKKGLFRTVAQRHKEQLSNLMAQLHSTHPHFVRCIIPNHEKQPGQLSAPLVLEQLRCNGVLEGIRIARTGFPNRLSFAEFRGRYEVLCKNMPKGYLEGQTAAITMLDKLAIDKSLFRVGITKVFFRAGVLAELEAKREMSIAESVVKFQCLARGYDQRRLHFKRKHRAEAARTISRYLRNYLEVKDHPVYRLVINMLPLVRANRTGGEVKKRDEEIERLNKKVQQEEADRLEVEEERRNALTEMQRVQQTLESERALALDKEEIFKRLQMREVELSEKLASAIQDQDTLEDDLEKLLDAKKRVEEQTEDLRVQLAQAGQHIARLEEEKRQLSDRVEALDKEIEDLVHQQARQQAQHSEEEKRLSKELAMAQSQLEISKRKAEDFEAQLLKVDQDLDVKLQQATKELQASKSREGQLAGDNRKVQKHLADLTKTSTQYEELVRRKESELVILRGDNKKYQAAIAKFDLDREVLLAEKNVAVSRLRELSAEMVAMETQKSRLEREAADAKKLLEERLEEGADAIQMRKGLEARIQELSDELFDADCELSKVRQSRDDVQLLAKHEYLELKREYQSLNEDKIKIEKELYVQQDTLRRAKESRATAEKERNDARKDIRELGEALAAAEEAKLAAEIAGQRAASKAATERKVALEREKKAMESRFMLKEEECKKLKHQVKELNKLILESDKFGLQTDQQLERLERELNTCKSRLKASERDNKSLLNQIQQKNLELSRAPSKASESARARLAALEGENSRIARDKESLERQLGEVEVVGASLIKKTEKQQLLLEDLTQEVENEHKARRTAEANASAFTAQLAEAERRIRSEEQLRIQSEALTKTLQATLDAREKEVGDLRAKHLKLVKQFEPDMSFDPPPQVDGQADEVNPIEKIDLLRRVQELQQDLRVQTAGRANAEGQLMELREKYEADLATAERPRASLGELHANTVPEPSSPERLRKLHATTNINVTPTRIFPGIDDIDEQNVDPSGMDKTADMLSFNNRMDLKAEVEELQNQLQMTQMQNRHLQSQIGRNTPIQDMWPEDSPSLARVRKLEKANNQLHDRLDDSARKISHLERSVHMGALSLRDVQTRSYEELYELISAQEEARRSLVDMNDDALAELTDVREHYQQLKHNRASLEVDLRDAKSDLQEMTKARDQDVASRNQLLQEFADLQIRFDAESSKLADVSAGLSLYKTRADEYFNKLEQAEIAVLKASRAEQFARAQAREAEDTCATIMSERQEMEGAIEDLQRQNQSYEERLEDMSADLEGAVQSRKRLQHELEDYRSQREMDIEDKEMSMEQTRKKYQAEFATLTNELDIAREEKLFQQAENTRLREDLEELRSKWDDEVLNSSTWSKEKARLEKTVQDVAEARDAAEQAGNEAQGKIVSLLSQVRSLRTGVDDITAERDALQREKRNLEARLEEARNGFEGLVRGDSPPAALHKELLELKSGLAQQEDIAAAAVEKMRRAEALASEIQKDMVAERETTVKLHKEKAGLEKSLKELQVRVVDLETKGYSSASQDVRFLHGRVQELEASLEAVEIEKHKNIREVRNVDRTVKDLQSQIDRRERANEQAQADIARAKDKIGQLLQTIDELQTSDSGAQLAARRAERELREEREAKLRLERELGAWKAMRMEKGRTEGGGGGVRELRRSGQWPKGGYTGSEYGGSEYGEETQVSRQTSLSKGFL